MLSFEKGTTMSTLEKLKQKFNEKPIPNNISFEEVERLAKSYNCTVISGGKHSKKIVDVPSGTVIPIPMHGKYVQEAYIKELKDLFSEIEKRNREAN